MQRANALVLEIKEVVQLWRDNCDTEFHGLFGEAAQLCRNADVEMTLPRRTGRQTKRANFPIDDPEAYYKCALYIPYLDHILMELETRFPPLSQLCAEIQLLIPSLMPKDPFPLTAAIEFYRSDLESPSVVRGELSRWFLRWRHVDMSLRPKTALEALDDASEKYCNL